MKRIDDIDSIITTTKIIKLHDVSTIHDSIKIK